MKKVIIALSFFIFVFFLSSASAKNIEKGAIEIDGALDLSISSSDTEAKATGYSSKTSNDDNSVRISALYYLVQNVGLGLQTEYGGSKNTNNSETEKITSLFIAPMVKYNYSLNEKTNLYFTGAVGITKQEVKEETFSIKTNGYGWEVGTGLIFFLTDSVALNGGIAYSSMQTETDHSSYSEDLDIDTSGMTFNVGISFFIK